MPPTKACTGTGLFRKKNCLLSDLLMLISDEKATSMLTRLVVEIRCGSKFTALILCKMSNCEVRSHLVLRWNKKSQWLVLRNTRTLLLPFCFPVTIMAQQLSIAIISILFITNAFSAPLVGHSTVRLRNSDTSCAPGGNFNLASFSLQLPTGNSGKVDQISATKLSGCDGWESPDYFYTSSSGALVMKVPSRSQCVTTPNSKHCRTELRESNPKSWDPTNDVNSLSVELSVPRPDDSKYGTVVGQVKVDDSLSKKPVAELFYNRAGILTIGVSQIPDVSSLIMTEIGQVEVGKRFGYNLRYESGNLTVQIDDKKKRVLSTGQLNSPKSYFKVGNYNQGNEPSGLLFYDIVVQHG